MRECFLHPDATESVAGKVLLATTTEATTGTNTSKAVTPAGIKAAINALIAGAPGALDTLDELAAAIGDDSNFRATILNAIAGKADTVHTHAISDIVNLASQLQAINDALSPKADTWSGLMPAITANTWTRVPGFLTGGPPQVHFYTMGNPRDEILFSIQYDASAQMVYMRSAKAWAANALIFIATGVDLYAP